MCLQRIGEIRNQLIQQYNNNACKNLHKNKINEYNNDNNKKIEMNN